MSIEVLLPDFSEEVPVVLGAPSTDPFQGDEEVKAWRERVSRRGWTGYYKDWPAKKALFGMAYADVIDFLMDRRKKAVESLEYYMTLPYLSNDIDSSELDVTFEHYKALDNVAGIKIRPVLRGFAGSLEGITVRQHAVEV